MTKEGLGQSFGSHRMECYVEYMRDGETQRTNVVFIQIIAGTDATYGEEYEIG